MSFPITLGHSSYRGYNTGGTSHSQAGAVANDIIVEQTDNTFDEAGNTVVGAVSLRLNDTPASGTGSTGALSYGTSPKARVSYVASWFDGIDRFIAAANYGAIASLTRPTTPPSSSATVLVNGTAYDDAGRAYQTTDPMGVINQTGFDNANRTTSTIEDVGGLARTTNYTHTLDSLPASMTALNATTGDQTTFWIYGTTLADSGVARNDLLRLTAYPGATLSWSTMRTDDWNELKVTQTLISHSLTLILLGGFFFRHPTGRPRGRRLCCRCSFSAVFCTQAGCPNGRERSMLSFIAASSACVCG